ncbi:hypothetical protein [Reichenbachiella versicolor]|uniref:hypothetical protein n=1 Tax=Reichenbachiella versicolor TaxID=1821036 RepID=UPI000D6EA5EE|nr:hypothetical protein [Reichenbachiella versicolor]
MINAVKLIKDKQYNSVVEKVTVVNQQMISDLKRAARISSLYNESFELHYINEEGSLIRKDAKILAVTEKFLTLHGGLSIPLNKIRRVVI